MKYGVCRTLVKETERGQVRYPAWWTGEAWSPSPIFSPPFPSREEAEAFIASLTNLPPLYHHVYEEGEPFGGDRLLSSRNTPTIKQPIKVGAIPTGDADASS